MSLLNDGLKRLHELRRTRPGTRRQTFRLLPVDYRTAGQAAGRRLVPALTVLAIGLSGIFFFRWFRGVEPESPPLAPAAVWVASASNPVAVTVPADEPNTEAGLLSWRQIRVNTNVQTRSTGGPPAPVTADAGPVAAGVEPAVEPVAADGRPVLRLQSIIYHAQNPSAVINGEMLRVGDTIRDARVTEIQRNQVILEWQTTNLILALPRL